jgi:hypothetical protein
MTYFFILDLFLMHVLHKKAQPRGKQVDTLAQYEKYTKTKSIPKVLLLV